MNEGRKDGRMDGRKEGRTDGRTEGGADGRTEEGRADERAEGRTDGRTDRQKDGRTEGRADGRKEGRSGEGHVLYGSALLPRRSKVQGEKPTGQAGGFGGRRHFNGDPSLPRRGFADLTRKSLVPKISPFSSLVNPRDDVILPNSLEVSPINPLSERCHSLFLGGRASVFGRVRPRVA